MTQPSDSAVSERVALKPCPFCQAAANTWLAFPQSDTPWFVSVDHADDCILLYAMGSVMCCATETEMAAAWNLRTPAPEWQGMESAFKLGDRVTKTKGAAWTGRVVGFYSTQLTPIGYAVESENEPGSVQIYPEAALSTPTGKQP